MQVIAVPVSLPPLLPLQSSGCAILAPLAVENPPAPSPISTAAPVVKFATSPMTQRLVPLS